jgi:hypothetical protein
MLKKIVEKKSETKKEMAIYLRELISELIVPFEQEFEKIAMSR